MTQLKHSPAPFKTINSANTISACYHVLSSDGKLIAGVPAYLDDERGLANVTLFAAAPILLEALTHMRKVIELNKADMKPGIYGYLNTIVEAAIAKATGGNV